MILRRFNARHFSIIVPFIFYLILLGVAYKLSMPLRSETKPQDFMSFLDRIKKKKSDLKKETIIEYHEISKRLPPVQVLTLVFKK